MADKANKIDPRLVDELLKDQDPEKVLSSDGLLGDLKKALAERMLDAEQAAQRLEEFDAAEWGQKIPGDRCGLAKKMGAGDSVLRVLGRGAPDHLHHQRDRVATQPGPQGREQARPFSQ
jgi:hypothetical protein